jgi:epidermal growth factor receptor substrate 15
MVRRHSLSYSIHLNPLLRNLADTRNRGVLDVTDFTIAMYFIQGLMSQKTSFVPAVLPPGLYEQAGGLPSNMTSVVTHLSGNSGSFSPVLGNFGQIQAQSTGQNQPLSPSHSGLMPQRRTPIVPARPSAPGFRAASNAHGNAHIVWDVTPTEKAEADAIFDGELDTKKLGFVEGEAAVPFMLKSQLPGEDLAQIWFVELFFLMRSYILIFNRDLADINSDGRLNRDGFAIAYHLIKNKLRGLPIPTQLPPSLIPPSLRSQASVFQTPPQLQPEPPRDLLDFDDTPPPSAVSPQITGNMAVLQPQSTGATAVPAVPPRSQVSDPFASSPFTSREYFVLLI